MRHNLVDGEKLIDRKVDGRIAATVDRDVAIRGEDDAEGSVVGGCNGLKSRNDGSGRESRLIVDGYHVCADVFTANIPDFGRGRVGHNTRDIAATTDVTFGDFEA